MDKKKFNRRYLILIASIAAVGGFLFGFDAGVISGTLNFLQDSKGWGISDSQVGWVTTAMLIGAIVGAGCSGRITDILGRRKVILAAAVIFAGGALYSGLAPDITSLIIARMIIGVAVGVSSFVIPLYLSEISSTKMRGTIVSFNQLMIAVGGKVSFLSDFIIADDGNPFSWRWMFIVGFFPAVVLLIGMFFLPESPRWLISKGQDQKGRAILQKVEEPQLVEESIEKMKADIIIKDESASYRELFKPWLRNALLIAVGIMFFQQAIGINTILYYSPKIFKMAGIDSNRMAILPSLIIAVFVLAATVLSMSLIDKIGRRRIYFIGLAGMIISLIGTGLAFYLEPILGPNLIYIAVVTILIYNSSFAFSLGPLGWLLISEVFPLKVRGAGMSIGSLSNWFFNALVTFMFLKIVNTFSAAGAFWIYAFVGILAVIWGYYYIPETKGVSLEKIEEHWRARKKPRELRP